MERSRWLCLLFGVIVVAAGNWWLAELPTDRNLVRAPTVRDFPDVRRPLAAQPTGTSGAETPKPVGDSDAAISLDGELHIGRRIVLHGAIRDASNLVTLWACPSDHQLLVVFGRDERTGRDRQLGLPRARIPSVQPGEEVTISGTIQRLPSPEDRTSWGLTRAQVAEAERRMIYLRVDTVTAT